MRIEFLTQDDPLYILPFFDEFLRNYSSEFEVLQISCCPTMGKKIETAALARIGGALRHRRLHPTAQHDCKNRGSWASCPGAAVPVSSIAWSSWREPLTYH